MNYSTFIDPRAVLASSIMQQMYANQYDVVHKLVPRWHDMHGLDRKEGTIYNLDSVPPYLPHTTTFYLRGVRRAETTLYISLKKRVYTRPPGTTRCLDATHAVIRLGCPLAIPPSIFSLLQHRSCGSVFRHRSSSLDGV